MGDTKTDAAAAATAANLDEAGEGAPPATLPLFYQNPEPLNPERHGGKSLRPLERYGFSANTNALPLNAVEFPLAARHFPIVFTQRDPAMPVAILGLRTDENLFVAKEDGRWLDDAYIPAYVRRYPFIFMDGPEDGKFILCIDEASELLVDGDERPLFDGTKPTEVAENALKFCSSFHHQYALTQEFSGALAQNDLLVSHQASMTLANGEQVGLGGFRVVDEGRFNALADEVVLEWRKKEWLGLIYVHLMSGANWTALGARTAKRA